MKYDAVHHKSLLMTHKMRRKLVGGLHHTKKKSYLRSRFLYIISTMTYKQALLQLTKHPMRMKVKEFLPFLSAALGATLVVFGIYHASFEMGVPWWILSQNGWPAAMIWEVLPIDLVGCAAFVVGSFALFGGLAKSHRQVLRLVRLMSLMSRHNDKGTAEHRLSRFIIAGTIIVGAVSFLSLPQVVIGVGILQTAISSLMLDDVIVPWWVYGIQACFSFVGMCCILLLGTYFRLVFSSTTSK